MKTYLKTMIICIAIPLLVGITASILTKNGMQLFSEISKPPLTPPKWLFPIVWTILYIMMGYASFIVISSNASQDVKCNALKLYVLQLVVNFAWSIIFFNKNAFWLSFLVILFLWLLIAFTIIAFREASKKASLLMIPYFIWVTFATYLTLGIALLN